MKKTFFLVVATMVSTTVFAQTPVVEEEGTENLVLSSVEVQDKETPLVIPVNIENAPEVLTEKSEAVERRTKATGLYYAKPEGLMYCRYYDDHGHVEVASSYYYPFSTVYTFRNMADDPSRTRWYTKGSASALGTQAAVGGDVGMRVSLGYMTGTIYLYNWDLSEYYNMAYSENGGDMARQYLSFVYWSGYLDRDWYGWVDNKSNTSFSSEYDTRYMYGSGNREREFTLLDKDGKEVTKTATFPRNSVWENLPAPASTLYADDVRIVCVTFGKDGTYEPIHNDAVLTMNIYDQESDELLETLTATKGDWTLWETGTDATYGTYACGVLRFTKKVDGEEVPIVINGKTKVEIVGFYNDDIDVGFRGCVIQDCDLLEDGLSCAYTTFIDPTGEYIISSEDYFSDYGLDISFYAVMDKVLVAEGLTWSSGETVYGYNYLTITSDGETCYNTGFEDYSNFDFGGLYVQTAMTWYDHSGSIARYSFDNTPDWLTDIVVEDYGGTTNTYKVKVKADKNEGDERTAVVHMQCKGYADSVDITITQLGGYDGINNVVAPTKTKDGAIYNLAGQRVTENAKGIVIKDGKKTLIK